jgi:hypothetical protein
MTQQQCPLCGEPVDAYEGADVYHMACLMADMAEQRKAQP